MDIFVAIKSALLTLSAVTELVGDDTHTCRIWNSWERVNAYPCLIIEVDSEGENNFLDTGKGDLVTADVTITARDNTHAGSHALAVAVRSNGTTPGTGMAGYHGSFDAELEHTTHSAIPKNDGSGANWYDHLMGFSAQWNDAA